MSVIQTVQEIMQTGLMPISVERQLLQRVLFTHMSDQERSALNRLIEARCRGEVALVL